MQDVTMCGCDLHDETMLGATARGRGAATKQTWSNDPEGRRKMLADLRRQAKGGRIVFAYEASCLGFGLYDFLTEAGVECHVLAPTKMAKSPKQRRQKCDEKDAEQILSLLRAHVLAGNPLPDVWIPDKQTRDDREGVRCRLDVGLKVTRLKTQIKTLLKRTGTRRPEGLGKNWTVSFRAWLRGLSSHRGPLPAGARIALGSLLRQLKSLEKELDVLDAAMKKLSETPRYAHPAKRLMTELSGVGLLTAMVFLTEMGDMSRFSNRKQVGAFFGLSVSSNDSGESERKGHITHQGSPRLRKALCQSVWSMRREGTDPDNAVYDRIAGRNPKKKKIATVACMRRRGVRMWHIALEAQAEAGIFREPECAAM